RARTGDPAAVRDVVVKASRHVFSTTLTTVAGFLPLLLGGGGFWPPLAATIAGGVTGATLLALSFVPAAYVLLMCRRSRATADGTADGTADETIVDTHDQDETLQETPILVAHTRLPADVAAAAN
ncbi:MAG: hypothetical protein AAGG46_06510, partial [Planctomycetota bacterium]